jgi:hypothetical protein
MAVRKRLKKRFRGNKRMTKLQGVHLLRGTVILDIDDEFPFRDAEHRRKIWFSNRDSLMHEHMAHKPGRRPDAWWCYEATEPRRMRGGQEYKGPVDGPFKFGMPRYLPEGVSWRDFETEAAYLDRHGLLTDAEREEIQNDPYAFDASIKTTA